MNRLGTEIRNPNLEIRKKFEIRNRNLKTALMTVFRTFEIRIWDLFRISNFEIRISVPRKSIKLFFRGPLAV